MTKLKKTFDVKNQLYKPFKLENVILRLFQYFYHNSTLLFIISFVYFFLYNRAYWEWVWTTFFLISQFYNPCILREERITADKYQLLNVRTEKSNRKKNQSNFSDFLFRCARRKLKKNFPLWSNFQFISYFDIKLFFNIFRYKNFNFNKNHNKIISL